MQECALLESPFPGWIAFATAAAGEADGIEPHPEELAALAPSAVAARRLTYVLGRVAARRALETLGRVATPVLPGADRAPRWPADIVGSISHTADCAVAAVASADRTSGVGLDLEEIGRAPREPIERFVADCTEQQWVAGVPERLVMVFSAKEAVFKAFYPLHGAFFGFDAVHLDPSEHGFTATLRVPLARWGAGSRLQVRCVLQGGFVLSAVYLPPPHPR